MHRRPVIVRLTTATALLTLAIGSSAFAQAPAKADQTQAFKEAFDKGMALAMLPMEQLIVEGCRKLAPGTSQGMEASWAKRMANPALKAHTQTPEYAQELADNRRLLDAEMAQPNAIQEWGPKCQQGLD